MLLVFLKVVDKGDKDGDGYDDSRSNIHKGCVNQRET